MTDRWLSDDAGVEFEDEPRRLDDSRGFSRDEAELSETSAWEGRRRDRELTRELERPITDRPQYQQPISARSGSGRVCRSRASVSS